MQTEYYIARPQVTHSTSIIDNSNLIFVDKQMLVFMFQKKRSAPVTFTTPIEITNKRPFSLKHPPCAYTLTEMFEDLQVAYAKTTIT